MLVDSHAHLQDRAFIEDRDEVIERALSRGVGLVLVPGTDLDTSLMALDLHSRHPFLIPAAGYHPHDAKKADPEGLGALEGLLEKPEVVAVGEIGLDYHYNFSSPEVQKKVLRRQLNLAVKVRKPVILHSRESQRELLSILDEEGRGKWSGVVHCFSGTVEEAGAFLDRGLYLGFTGVVTYKKAEETREVVRITPPDRILVETDAPYLAPIPHRGRRNEPAYIPLILEEIARLHGLPVNDMARIVHENTVKLFGLH